MFEGSSQLRQSAQRSAQVIRANAAGDQPQLGFRVGPVSKPGTAFFSSRTGGRRR